MTAPDRVVRAARAGTLTARNWQTEAALRMLHNNLDVGIGRSIHAGQVCVADSTELAAQKLARVLPNDPGMGVIRHVDAGDQRAGEVADERGVHIPMEAR